MQKIFDFFNNKKDFSNNIGIQLLEVRHGYAKARLKINDFHLNQADIAHGGAIFTLADFTFAVASNSFGMVSLAINTSISFMNPAKKGDELIAEAKLIDESRKLGNYEVLITCKDKKIAFFTGTVYKKDSKINFKGGKNDF